MTFRSVLGYTANHTRAIWLASNDCWAGLAGAGLLSMVVDRHMGRTHSDASADPMFVATGSDIGDGVKLPGSGYAFERVFGSVVE